MYMKFSSKKIEEPTMYSLLQKGYSTSCSPKECGKDPRKENHQFNSLRAFC